MTLTSSSMRSLNKKAKNFTLPNINNDKASNELISLTDIKSKIATVIIFICNHCPYVKHIIKKLVEIAVIYQKRGIHFVAINSNDIEQYPEDSPKKMREFAQKNKFCFPYLWDEDQSVAKAYEATCTPDFFVFDNNLSCVYRGRFDDTSPGKLNMPVSGDDLCTTLDNLLNKLPIDKNQYPSMGCNIKWKRVKA